MKRKVKMGLIVLAVLAVLLGGGAGYLFLSQLDPYRLPSGDWALFKQRFLSPQGRVIDTGNDNISHSEGQGYGMLIAEAYGDRPAFDRVWNWTKQNLQTRPGDKLLSWLWKPAADGQGGAVADPNNASDGDLLVAWALVRASTRWSEYRYEQEAAQILADLSRLDLKTSASGEITFLPGTDGFVKEDGIIVNLSYYIFPAFADLARTFPNSPWAAIGESGYALLARARFGEWSLPPDWAMVKTDQSIVVAPGFPPEFGYNAVRIPLHAAWGNSRAPAIQAESKFWGHYSAHPPTPATMNLETNQAGPHPALPGMLAVAAFVQACGANQTLTVKSLPALTKDEPYFSASLKLLTKLAIRDTFAQN